MSSVNFPELPPNEPNDALLTLAVINPGPLPNQLYLYTIDMQAYSTPLAFVSLIHHRFLSLHYLPNNDAIQFWYHPPRRSPLKPYASSALHLRLVRWLKHVSHGARLAPIEPSFSKQWVYETVRRTVHDDDQQRYCKFLERVRENTDLNVTLRPYQQRAVAWMLSRELDTPPSQRYHVWHFAHTLAEHPHFKTNTLLPIEPHVVFDLFQGDIHLGIPNDPRNNISTTGKGGLLCDEMGLGKTVEIMQLVLCNQHTQSLRHPTHQPSTSAPTCCSYCETACTSASTRPHPKCVDCGRPAHDDCVHEHHKAFSNNGYVCPSCITHLYELSKGEIPHEKMPKSKATVIIIPTSLLLQWQDEISKHVRDALKIVIFQGLRITGYIPQRILREADVVLTTYDALRADVNIIQSIRNPRTSRRFERKYIPLPVPLLAMHWHRLALDESQMLGSGANNYTKAAEMASYLSATYKWCVTGTPMSTGLHDVVSMFGILELEDADKGVNWASLLSPSVYEEDQSRVARILRNVMWRTQLYDVQLTELNIPERHFEAVHTLLGPVEKFHYNSLQEHLQRGVTQWSRAENVSSNLLTMLRQACCHPRIGASGRRLVTGAVGSARPRENAVEKAEKRAESPLELSDVLESLLTKGTVECEEDFRNLIASMNGQAGISLLIFTARARSARCRYISCLIEAITIYRDALRLSEYNTELVKMDDIQVIHIKYNLHDALQWMNNIQGELRQKKQRKGVELRALDELSKVGSSIQEGHLLQDVSDLKDKYVAEAQAKLHATSAVYNSKYSKLGATPLIPIEAAQSQGAEGSEPLDLDGSEMDETTIGTDKVALATPKRRKTQWWEIGIAILLEEGKGSAFVDRMIQRLTDPLTGSNSDVRTLATRLHSLHALARVISEELENMQEVRMAFRTKLLELPGSREPTEEDISESGLCGQCREVGTGAACSHCRAEPLITNVERKLYSLRERVDEDEISNDVLGVTSLYDPEADIIDNVRSRGRKSQFQSNSSRIYYQGEAEVILVALASIVRKKRDDVWSAEVDDWFKRLAILKEEHNDAKQMFEAQRSLLARLDEIKMAQMRMSVLDNSVNLGTLSELELRHRIPRHRLDHMLLEFKTERAAAEASFRNTRGRLTYLRSLRKSYNPDEKGHSGGNDLKSFESCPICWGSSDSFTSIAVLPCGHLFCCDCALNMITKKELRTRVKSILCPQCRSRCLVDDINFTSTTEESPRKKRRIGSRSTSPDGEDFDNLSSDGKEGSPEVYRGNVVVERPSSFYKANVEVLGQFGSKATALVRLLRCIWNENDEEKVLIFSEWSEVLQLVRKALERNSILFCDGDEAKSSANFAKVVNEFKESQFRKVFLLPLRRAGAGLNLTEARHVVLVEPSMEVSLEAQAVGRVHRIGQTRETYIHRIIVRHTIEEMILQLGNKYRIDRNTSDEAKVEINDVMQGIRSIVTTENATALLGET